MTDVVVCLRATDRAHSVEDHDMKEMDLVGWWPKSKFEAAGDDLGDEMFSNPKRFYYLTVSNANEARLAKLLYPDPGVRSRKYRVSQARLLTGAPLKTAYVTLMTTLAGLVGWDDCTSVSLTWGEFRSALRAGGAITPPSDNDLDNETEPYA